MSDPKLWCWEATKSGPDWRFVASVSPESEGALAQIVAGVVPDGYAYYVRKPAHCQYHQQVCSYHTFIDTTNAEAYANNLKGHNPRNIWIYNSIEIHRDMIEIECGYGGRGEAHNRAETSFLLDTFEAPGVALRDWKVLVGGNGYDYKTICEGAGLDSFRSYIA